MICVKVHIKSGADLAIADVYAKTSNPYCIVTLAGQKLKTKSIESCVNPTWNEILDFTIDNNISPLSATFRVLHSEKGGMDTPLGNTMIPLHLIKEQGKLFEGNLPLKHTKRGSLNIFIEVFDNNKKSKKSETTKTKTKKETSKISTKNISSLTSNNTILSQSNSETSLPDRGFHDYEDDDSPRNLPQFHPLDSNLNHTDDINQPVVLHTSHVRKRQPHHHLRSRLSTQTTPIIPTPIFNQFQQYLKYISLFFFVIGLCFISWGYFFLWSSQGMIHNTGLFLGSILLIIAGIIRFFSTKPIRILFLIGILIIVWQTHFFTLNLQLFFIISVFSVIIQLLYDSIK